MANFERAFKEVLGVEGGYVNDLSDSGGETNWGVTKRTAERYGYVGSMRSMSIEDARSIYRRGFWDKLWLHTCEDDAIACELFEQGVNMGLGRPGKFLQLALNSLNNRQQHWKDVVVDGGLGPKTMETLNTALKRNKMKERLLKLLNAQQAQFYMELTLKREKDERFLGGWLDNRVVMAVTDNKVRTDFNTEFMRV